MRDRRQRALAAVRMVRERVEEREERALGEASRESQRARETAERLRKEICEAAAKGVPVLSSGREIRQRAAELGALLRQRAEAVEEMERLELRRTEQMQSYRAAHAGRKAIEELQEQRRAARMAALLGRERKSGEELFLGRRMLLQQRFEQEMRER